MDGDESLREGTRPVPMCNGELLYMITYVEGNLFESPAQVLVNTVNTVGVMGKGIARQFKSIYPEMFRHYQILCEKRMFDVGQLWLYKTPHKWILNFPTKRHWRSPSKVEYIKLGLDKFVRTYAEKGITSIAFPRLGCGNGELDWETQVRPIMEQYLNGLPINVFVYLYPMGVGVPEHRIPKETAEWLRSEPMSLPFAEVMDDLLHVLEERTEFSTITDDARFKCEVKDGSDGEPGLLIEDGERAVMIENDQLYALWQQIRDYGFCADFTIPGGLEPFAPYILGLLVHLPYLKPITLSRKINGTIRKSPGLQVVPPVVSSTEIKRAAVALQPM